MAAASFYAVRAKGGSHIAVGAYPSRDAIWVVAYGAVVQPQSELLLTVRVEEVPALVEAINSAAAQCQAPQKEGE